MSVGQMASLGRMQDYDKAQQTKKEDEKKQNLAPLVQASQAAQTRLALFADPNDPTKAVQGKEAEYNAAHDQLADIIGKMRTILHPPPADDPHGLGYLAHRATDKLHITRDLTQRAKDQQAGRVAKYNDQTGQQVQATVQGIMPPKPGISEQVEQFKKDYKAVTGKDAPEDAVLGYFNQKEGIKPEKETPEAWKNVDIILPDNSRISAQHNEKSGEYRDIANQPIPAERLTGAKVFHQDKPPNATQIELEAYENSFGKPIKWADMSPQQKAGYPAWKAAQSAMTTTSTDVKMVQQGDQWVPVVVQKTSTRGAATKPSASASKIPSGTTPSGPKAKELKDTSNKLRGGAGVISVGEPIGHHKSSAENKAEKDLVDAVALDTVAREVEKKPNDAYNQKRLIVALEKMAAGRFTVQALDYVKQAGWGNTLEEWANKPDTGALPANLMKQVIDGAHQNLISKQAALKAAKELSGESSGSEAKKKVSLKKAMALPRNKGKSEAEVRSDIEAHGHEVTP